MIENVVKTFYEALEKGKLMGLKCPKCGTHSFPPKPTCNKCGNFELKWVEMSGKGVVNYYNIENFPGGEFQAVAPYAVGIVITKEGVPFNTMIKGVDLNDPWKGNLELPMEGELKTMKVGTKKVLVFEVIKKKVVKKK